VGEAISEVLPFAVGVAVSPVPIIAVILMLFSSRARTNGPAFLLGWAAGLTVVTVVAYLLADASDVGSDSDSSDAVSWLKILLGVLLLFAAVRNWRKRPAPGVTPEMPKWMTGIDALSPGKALGLGVLLSSVNPKNLAMSIGAAAGVAQLGVSTEDAVVALIVFVVVASLTIAGPVAYYLIGGEKAEARLTELKDWLAVNNTAVMAVLLLVFGVVLISKGLGSLTTT
jgi:threonine/homoserine/homoserine lactone efflux protein